ncbi:unnamed protein product [Allacma fusca]|uniref:Uncharacterized protein n=1 Tax=Allacma fusca TaxID=39272 RepID=A0A8J2KP14_9HEXA|nr:unnamed protein product [Allacma fusca]
MISCVSSGKNIRLKCGASSELSSASYFSQEVGVCKCNSVCHFDRRQCACVIHAGESCDMVALTKKLGTCKSASGISSLSPDIIILVLSAATTGTGFPIFQFFIVPELPEEVPGPSIAIRETSELQAKNQKRKKDYRIAHRDTINESQRDYRIANRDAMNEYRRNYGIAHTDALNAHQHDYRIAHRDAHNEYQQDYRIAHRDARNKYHQDYRVAHRDALNEHQQDCA